MAARTAETGAQAGREKAGGESVSAANDGSENPKRRRPAAEAETAAEEKRRTDGMKPARGHRTQNRLDGNKHKVAEAAAKQMV